VADISNDGGQYVVGSEALLAAPNGETAEGNGLAYVVVLSCAPRKPQLNERESRSMLVSTTMVTSHVRAADNCTHLLHAGRKAEGGVSCCIGLKFTIASSRCLH
jgi:hypothetical protein